MDSADQKKNLLLWNWVLELN